MRPIAKQQLNEKLFNAVVRAKTNDVRALIRKGADVNSLDTWDLTALHHACRKGHPDIVRLLLEAGADPNRRRDEDPQGETPLDIVCTSNFVPGISSLLLSHGADVNVKDPLREETLLHNACREGLTEVVRFLLAHGADVHCQDKFGNTPLDIAMEVSVSNPARETILDLFREYVPDLVLEKFCTAGPGQ